MFSSLPTSAQVHKAATLRAEVPDKHDKPAKHVVVSLNYCSQNGGNLYRAPYYNGNPNTGPRIIGDLDQSPRAPTRCFAQTGAALLLDVADCTGAYEKMLLARGTLSIRSKTSWQPAVREQKERLSTCTHGLILHWCIAQHIGLWRGAAAVRHPKGAAIEQIQTPHQYLQMRARVQ